MLIYRLESPTELDISGKVGVGYYRYAVSYWDFVCEDDALELMTHPAPSDDSKLAPEWAALRESDTHHDWRFGFTSLAQFRRWFFNLEALEDIQDIVSLSIYRVTECHEGYTQAIFNVNDKYLKRICTVPAHWDDTEIVNTALDAMQELYNM